MVRLLGVLLLLEGILPAADGVAPDPYFPAFHARMHADHNNGARPSRSVSLCFVQCQSAARPGPDTASRML